jgi:hypothetical protein
VVEIILREGTLPDLSFLREMLFEAVFWRPDVLRPPMHEGLSHPELAKLLEGAYKRSASPGLRVNLDRACADHVHPRATDRGRLDDSPISVTEA